jgi:hypothetical protein
MQPGIGVFRQLNAYPPGGADHCLRLLCIGFEANTGEEANYDIERPLEEFWVARRQVRIIDIEYGKESGHQTVDLVRFERAVVCRLVIYCTKVLTYRTNILLVHLTKVRR